MSDQTPGPGYTMTIERVFNAPRELVFACFTDPRHMREWWGPRGFDAPVCEMDARPGGKIRIDMRGPEPMPVNPVVGEFLEVVPPSRLVFTAMAHRHDDGVWGVDNINVLIFGEEPGGRTRMHLTTVVRGVCREIAPALSGMSEGWNSSFDKLDELLATRAV